LSDYALTYLALVARDTEAVCRFLGGSLGLTRTDLALEGQMVPFFAVGEAALGIFDPENTYLDDPRAPGVHHMALGSNDPARTAERHGLQIIRAGVGPSDKRFVAVAQDETCGIRTRFIEPLNLPVQESRVERIDHLGIASTDIDENIRVFVDTLGCHLESTEVDVEIRNVTESFISDKYGAVYHARPPEILGGLKGAFVTIGDCDLEIMQDFDPSMKPQDSLGESEGNTKGDQSAIAKFIERRGPGLVHVAFATKDIDAVLQDLDAEGWRMIDTTGRPGGRSARIGFVHPSNFGGGLLTHFVQHPET
jgi:catechol 2,3-dioxygenase-like lactoylglutathione lyase family enzyme